MKKKYIIGVTLCFWLNSAYGFDIDNDLLDALSANTSVRKKIKDKAYKGIQSNTLFEALSTRKQVPIAYKAGTRSFMQNNKLKQKDTTIPKLTHQLKITLHNKSPYNEADVHRIIHLLNTLISNKSSYRDTPVNVRFNITGGITKDYSGDGVIDSEQELLNLCSKATSHVVVVKSIRWCDRPGKFIGCTYQHHQCAVLTKVKPSWEEVLWAHELGHMAGLPHRSGYRALMRPAVSGRNQEINSREKLVYETSHISYSGKRRYYEAHEDAPTPKYCAIETIDDVSPPPVRPSLLFAVKQVHLHPSSQ